MIKGQSHKTNFGFTSRIWHMLALVLTCLAHASIGFDMCGYIINPFIAKCVLGLLPLESNVGQKSRNVLQLLYFTINWLQGVKFDMNYNIVNHKE